MVLDSHPEGQSMTHRYKTQPQDKQAGLSGKVDNDFNKVGEQHATQTNEGRRTPQSRHDREAQIGNNQSKMRGGSPQGSNTFAAPKPGARGRRGG
jgi:hypothetical protein